MRQDLYDELFELEERHWWHVVKRKWCRTLAEKFSEGQNLKMLDIGCGTGQNMKELGSMGKVWGVDISNKAIEYCIRRGLKRVIRGRMEKLPFRNSSFDVVVALDVLEHGDDSRALKEVKRVLRPGGMVVISVPAYQWLWSKWDEVLGHKRRYRRSKLVEAVGKHGFNVLRATYYNLWSLPFAVVIRNIKTMWFKERGYESDFRFGGKWINRLALGCGYLECYLANMLNITWPMGLGIFVVARKSILLRQKSTSGLV